MCNNMKKTSISKNMAIVALLVAAGNAVAAGPTATLQVKGNITPAACTPTLANGGIVDFGATSSSEITSGANFRLGSKNIGLNITCTGATKMMFAVTDNRSDSVVYVTQYGAQSTLGLGKTTDNKSIGGYAITYNTPMVDGEAGTVVASNNAVNWGSIDSSIAVRVSGNATTGDTLSFAKAGESVPTAFEQATVNVLITEPGLSKEMKNITEVQNLDGNATLNFSYL
jgi:type 1 fimbria pilin